MKNKGAEKRVKAILIDKIKKIDKTEAMILRYLLRALRKGGCRIDYDMSSRALGMTYSCFSKGVERLIENEIVTENDGKLYFNAQTVVEVV